jgi:hypothetical protein
MGPISMSAAIIATQYLVDELNLPLIGEIYSHSAVPLCVVKWNQPTHVCFWFLFSLAFLGLVGDEYPSQWDQSACLSITINSTNILNGRIARLWHSLAAGCRY